MTTSDAPLMVSVSGCRGIVGKSLTPEVVAAFVRAAVAWMPGPADGRRIVVLARDGRVGGESVHRVAENELIRLGCHVVDIGVATTPTCGVMVRERRATGGIVITASHNPAEWNGIKVIDGRGAAPSPADAKRIIDGFRAGSAFTRKGDPGGSMGAGTVERDEKATDVHVRRVLDAVAQVVPLNRIREKRFGVVLDSVNASGRIGGRKLLDELGCRVVHLNHSDSGVFPHPPEPTLENLVTLCEEVGRASKSCAAPGTANAPYADGETCWVGFAQDPDADRLAIVDECGHYIGEEYTLVLAVLSLLSSMKKEDAARAVFAANLSTSRMIDDAAAKYGARVVRTAVGEANVVDGMTRNAANMGGEGNGGVIWPMIVPIRDSLSAMALTLALMASSGKSVSELVRMVPSYAIEKRKVELGPGGGVAERAVAAVKSLYQSRGAKLDEQDGVRADFDEPGGQGRAWVHVRASNTEPIVRFIAEAPTRHIADAILDEAQAACGKGS
ncbi:MAG TPA: hypothetical protein VG797_00705 [Phycisphaerales bacterium]|nr:hypothetical protein [Phycisphaerales bacterium]